MESRLRKIKVAYFGISAYARHVNENSLQCSDGMPNSSATDLEALLELYDVTGNRGNMIHGEAPQRMFDVDREHSAYIAVDKLISSGWDAERVAEALSKNYDLVIYSTANAIRPKQNPGCTAQILDFLTVPFVILGMGMQNPLPPSTESLHPNLVDLLKVGDRKAAVFAVRGKATESWLHSVGFKRAIAVGCPSLFVYPQNIVSLRSVKSILTVNILTGGYISARIPRASVLIDLLSNSRAHYVMQDEMAEWQNAELVKGTQNLYNDATGEVALEVMQKLLLDIHDEQVNFASYRWFQNPSAWRSFAASCDCYVGDRLHGGVAALQVGRPALFISDDQRVAELVEFFDLPCMTLVEAASAELPELISERLSLKVLARFVDTYASRFHEFQKMFGAIGLPVIGRVSTATTNPVMPLQTTVSRTPIRRKIVKSIRRTLRSL